MSVDDLHNPPLIDVGSSTATLFTLNHPRRL
jgi:hypothetical protein